MFGALTEKFQTVFSKLVGQKKLTEDNIQEAVDEVRLALLEADVQYSIVKTFVKRVKEKAVGQELIKSVEPGQQFAKIVHDELIALMGGEVEGLVLKKRPAVLMLCGLQGSGKTTQAVKIAHLLKKQKEFVNPCVVACDLQRPAAREQLQTLAEHAAISYFGIPNTKNPLEVAKEALKKAKDHGWDLLIFDTAGRLHIDDALMQELKEIHTLIQPEEVLFVANAALGQDAVKVAQNFHEKIAITGTILTMLDGTSRAGAAISIREATQRPLKFEGIGERIEDIQPFNPTSMADRILGMGDTINLVRRAQEHIEEEEAKKIEEKLMRATFTYEDYLKQMQIMKKMGSMKSILGMLPGMSMIKDFEIDDEEFFKMEAMIQSMTNQERQERCELSISRRKRVARGSGTSIDQVNKLVKSFKQTKQFFKNAPNMKQLQKLMGG